MSEPGRIRKPPASFSRCRLFRIASELSNNDDPECVGLYKQIDAFVHKKNEGNRLFASGLWVEVCWSLGRVNIPDLRCPNA